MYQFQSKLSKALSKLYVLYDFEIEVSLPPSTGPETDWVTSRSLNLLFCSSTLSAETSVNVSGALDAIYWYWKYFPSCCPFAKVAPSRLETCERKNASALCWSSFKFWTSIANLK